MEKEYKEIKSVFALFRGPTVKSCDWLAWASNGNNDRFNIKLAQFILNSGDLETIEDEETREMMRANLRDVIYQAKQSIIRKKYDEVQRLRKNDAANV